MTALCMSESAAFPLQIVVKHILNRSGLSTSFRRRMQPKNRGFRSGPVWRRAYGREVSVGALVESCTSVYERLRVFTSVCVCLRASASVCECLRVFASVYKSVTERRRGNDEAVEGGGCPPVSFVAERGIRPGIGRWRGWRRPDLRASRGPRRGPHRLRVPESGSKPGLKSGLKSVAASVSLSAKPRRCARMGPILSRVGPGASGCYANRLRGFGKPGIDRVSIGYRMRRFGLIGLTLKNFSLFS